LSAALAAFSFSRRSELAVPGFTPLPTRFAKPALVEFANLVGRGEGEIASLTLAQGHGLLCSHLDLLQDASHAMRSVAFGSADQVMERFSRFDFELLLQQCRALVHLGGHIVNR